MAKRFRTVAIKYAEDVVAGRVIIGAEVVAACRRFLDDLGRDDLELRDHKPDLAINIMQTTLVHAKGEDLEGRPLLGRPFILEPWEIFIVYNLLGFYYKGTDRQRFNEAFIEVARKNGKTSFIAGLAWAVYSILIKKYTERYDNFIVTRRVMLWAFLTGIPLMLLTSGMPDLAPLFTRTDALLSWLFLGILGNAVCFAVWNIAFQRLGVVVTNNYLYASPFVTMVVGWLLLDEKISVMGVVGAVLITAGVFLAQREHKTK